MAGPRSAARRSARFNATTGDGSTRSSSEYTSQELGPVRLFPGRRVAMDGGDGSFDLERAHAPVAGRTREQPLRGHETADPWHVEAWARLRGRAKQSTPTGSAGRSP